MENLGLVAELFKTSSRFARAATTLEKMAAGKKEIESPDQEALQWSGNFLFVLDWNAKTQSSNPVTGNFALQATAVRPTFYSCLFRMAQQIRDAGMSDEKQLKTFLINFYNTLLSTAKKSSKKKGKLNSNQLKLGALILHEVSKSILVQINNNGLPQPSATLKDEWKPTTNELEPTFAPR